MASKIIVLISGGNAGIGYEIVKKLAHDHASTHHIFMGTRSLSKGEDSLKTMGSPANVTPVELDITSDDCIASAIATIEKAHGKLDVLINNAGTAGDDLPKGKSPREIYSHVYSVNCTSAALLTEAATPLLAKASPGPAKVIFLSSTLGSIGALIDGYHKVPVPWYNSSKAALNYLSAWYARSQPEWRVNSVCPGLNSTGLAPNVKLTDETHPRNGAIRVCELVDDESGVTGTYSRKGPEEIPW